jgi:hypothetical protein
MNLELRQQMMCNKDIALTHKKEKLGEAMTNPEYNMNYTKYNKKVVESQRKEVASIVHDIFKLEDVDLNVLFVDVELLKMLLQPTMQSKYWLEH